MSSSVVETVSPVLSTVVVVVINLVVSISSVTIISGVDFAGTVVGSIVELTSVVIIEFDFLVVELDVVVPSVFTILVEVYSESGVLVVVSVTSIGSPVVESVAANVVVTSLLSVEVPLIQDVDVNASVFAAVDDETV